MIRKLLLSTVFVASGFVTLLASNVSADAPGKYQPEITNLVSTYLSYYHYQRYTIDNKISRRVLNEYLSTLDYNRIFFYASDIEEFKRFETKLDDDLRADPVNLEKPFLIFNRYKQRVRERVAASLTMLDGQFDYTKDEFYEYDRSEVPWVKTRAEMDDLWRRRIKEEMVRFKLRDKADDESVDLLRKRYKRLEKTIIDYESIDILENFLTSLAESFDPHSAYLKPTSKENFDIQMGHSLEGIGATLRTEGEYTVVIDVVKGGPADHSKQVHPNDKIIAVAQGDEPAEDVVDLRLDKVVKLIRGAKGTKVRLTIIPAKAADHSETKEVVLIRDRVQITSRDAKSVIEEVEIPGQRKLRVGVIEVPSFYMDSAARHRGDANYKSTTRDVKKLIRELEAEKVDGLVVDLRQNGGGSLDEAIRLTGLFIDHGPVVQIKDYRGKVEIESDPDPAMVYDGPLVVLTSIFSASASEIFSSAIQDYERGVVVGSDSTHGKGTVQNVISLQPTLSSRLGREFQEDIGGALKLTTHKFYRISGGSTQFKGVVPDLVLPSPYDGLDVTEDTLDHALPWDEIQPADHKTYGRVRHVLSHLKDQSQQRIKKDPEFSWVLEDVAYRDRIRKENRISLNLETRSKEKKELEAKDSVRDESRKKRVTIAKATLAERLKDRPPVDEDEKDEEEEVLVPDFVLDEALLITADYISFQKEMVAGIHSKKDAL